MYKDLCVFKMIYSTVSTSLHTGQNGWMFNTRVLKSVLIFHTYHFTSLHFKQTCVFAQNIEAEKHKFQNSQNVAASYTLGVHVSSAHLKDTHLLSRLENKAEK